MATSQRQSMGTPLMKLYLDTEFNGHGGELISLALAAPEGESFYGRASYLGGVEVHPWVEANVLPVLGKVAWYVPPSDFTAALHRFLERHPNADIYADWPDDFAHLMQALRGATYEQALDYQCTMHLIKTPPGEPKPEVPHNALSDATALMKWHTA